MIVIKLTISFANQGKPTHKLFSYNAKFKAVAFRKNDNSRHGFLYIDYLSNNNVCPFYDDINTLTVFKYKTLIL